MTVTVELSPIKDRTKQQEKSDSDGVAGLEEVDDRENERMSNTSNYEEVEETYYDSDPDSKQDYERERYADSDYRSSKGRRGNYDRNGPSNRRGRPYDRYRGGGRGHFSNYRDNRRRSFPEGRGFRGRGRGWNDSRDYGRDKYRDSDGPRGFRPRGGGNGRQDYEDNYRSRGRGGGERMSDDYSPRGYNRGGRGQRDRQDLRGRERFRGGNRGRDYRERPQYERERVRPDPERWQSPPSPPRLHPERSGYRRSLGSPVNSEYIAKQYRMRRSEIKNGQESGSREFVESSSRNIDSRHNDIEYRQHRRSGREEQMLPREKEYRRNHGSDMIELEKHASRKTYRHPEKAMEYRSDYHLSRKHQSSGIEEDFARSYRKEDYAQKRWEASNIRDRSPHGSPPRARYLDRYESPPSPSPRAYAYSDPHREESRSRSRSVSSHGDTSDTSRGPSASPSPPRHKHSLREFRSTSRSRSRSLSPLLGTYGSEFPSRHPSRREVVSPSRSPVYHRSPSPAYDLADPALFPPSPTYDPPLKYQPPSPVYSPPPSHSKYARASPTYPRQDHYGSRQYPVEKEQMEFERLESVKDHRIAEYSAKKSKREVHDRNRDRKIIFDAKRSEDRFIEIGSKRVRSHDDKKRHGRPLSEAFDMHIGASSAGHDSSPPTQRRSHSSPKRRRRAGHKEDRSDVTSRRHVSKRGSPPMSTKMMRGH